MLTKVPRRKTRTKNPARPRRATPSKLTTKLVRIGNSRGVRLPKIMIEQIGLRDNVEMMIGDDEIILRAPRRKQKNRRAGWDEAYRKALAKLGPVALERERAEWEDWQNIPNEFDDTEWTW
jgi:antitoxin MazE